MPLPKQTRGRDYAPVADQALMDAVDALLDKGTNDITSIAELARKMHEQDSRKNPESWRKQLRRWRKDHATETDIGVIAQAFNVSRDKLPAEAAKPTIPRRLEELEAEVADLTTALAAAKQVDETLRRRLAKLEKAVAPLLQAAAPGKRSTRRAQTAR